MSHLIAVAYRDAEAARSGLWELSELSAEHAVALDDAVIAVRGRDGRIRLQRSERPVAGSAPSGALIGLLFLAPHLGTAIGARAGGVTEAGSDHRFMEQLGTELQPGTAAVIVLVRALAPTKVLRRLSPFGGRVIASELSTEAELQLQEALGAPAVAAVSAPAG